MEPNTPTPESSYNGEHVISDDGYTVVTLCKGNNGTDESGRLIYITVYKRRGHKDTWVMDSGIAVTPDAFKTMSTHINKYIADHML